MAGVGGAQAHPAEQAVSALWWFIMLPPPDAALLIILAVAVDYAILAAGLRA